MRVRPKTSSEKTLLKGVLNMSTIDITRKVKTLKELRAEIEALEAEAKAIEDEIKGEMLTREVDEMQVDVFKIRYKTVQSSRFDSRAFKETHSELYNQYCKTTEYKRFTVA